jgi:glycerol kinase
MTKYVMAIDQGTTSTRAIIFNTLGKLLVSGRKSMNNTIPSRDGWSTILWRSGPQLNLWFKGC